MNETIRNRKLLHLGTLILRDSTSENLEKNLFEVLPEVIDIDAAAIFARNSDNTWSLQATTPGGEHLKTLRTKLKKFTRGIDEGDRRPQDLASPLIVERPFKRRSGGFGVAIAFPLAIMGKIEAFIVAARNSAIHFTMDDINRLDNVAAILSTTLENRSAVQQLSLHATTLEKEKDFLKSAVDQRTKELYREREFSSVLSEGAPYLTFVLNGKGKILFANHFSHERTGYSADELAAMKFIDLFRTEESPENPIWFENILKTGKSQRFRTTYISNQGDYRTIIWNANKRTDESDTHSEIICIGMDLTRMTLLEKHNQIILETIPDGLFRVNDNFEVVEVNNYAAEMIGLKAEEIIGKKCYDTICRFKKSTCPVFTEGRDFITYEAILPTEEKDKNHVLKSVRKYSVGGHEYALETFKDISNLKQMEKKILDYAENLEIKVNTRTLELREAQRNLIQFEKLAATGRFAACMAHEINSPIFGIKGCLQSILEEAELKDDLKEFVEIAIAETDRISDLIMRMQNIDKESKGERKREDINKIVSDVALLYTKLKGDKNVNIETNLKKLLPETVVSADQIKQVFINLINNAIDAMPDGGDLTIISTKHGNMLEIKFTDTGCGITKKVQERIFDAFYTTKAVVKGVGLGLPMCWGIVRSHGGRILVNSKLGKGSTFTVALPIAQKEEKKELAAGG